MDGYSFVRCHGTELRSRRDNDNDDQARERGTWNLNTRLQVITEGLCPVHHRIGRHLSLIVFPQPITIILMMMMVMMPFVQNMGLLSRRLIEETIYNPLQKIN